MTSRSASGATGPVVAVLGTGTMGAAMAANISAAGMGSARDAGLRLGIAETIRERLRLASDGGLGRADVAATYRVPRRAAASRDGGQP